MQFDKLVKDYSPTHPIKGIIHIGAHLCEEHEVYNLSGLKKQIWIEGNPRLHEENARRFNGNEDVKVFNEVIADTEKEIKLFISNASMSSSILPLKEHRNQFPGIIYIGEHVTKSKRFDTMAKEQDINMDEYNFLNIDIQGAELLALKSFGELISNIDYIFTEINTIEMYEGCVIIEELDDYLLQKGFERKETAMYELGGWGDALYLRIKKS